MRAFFAAIAVAVIALVTYATTASGGEQAVTPRQFAALKSRVAKLERHVNKLQGFANFTGDCVFFAGGQLVPIRLTPQWHVVAAGETPELYALTTNQACASLVGGHG